MTNLSARAEVGENAAVLLREARCWMRPPSADWFRFHGEYLDSLSNYKRTVDKIDAAIARSIDDGQ